MSSDNKNHTSANGIGLLPRANKLAGRLGLDWFLLALLLMIVLAYLWPQVGLKDGPLALGTITDIGVSVIFLFYGLRLSPEKLKAGLSNWRLHLLVQLSTFVLFPVLVLLAMQVVGANSSDLLWMGIFYLAALPSTVSSSVVMVSVAGGNMPAAIFNASISSLLGVFITPLWMSLFLSAGAGSIDMQDVMLKLVLQVLAPVILGVILHSRFGAFAEKHKARIRFFDQSIILLIVYSSFCESFSRNLFGGFSLLHVLGLSFGMLALFFVVYGIITAISRLLKLTWEDKITAVFCGSKKSLVHGTVMSKVLFPDANVVGIILLPIMLYHALQLVIASIIAQASARKGAAKQL
ncbi:bile acid:sodium symporter [Pontibacter sp. KCTC 32443]|uniref:bile acid:sodium symporter family protein n=1 Tax=Pontibacter TaxID=323449 RepID=UPI00164EB9E4|nr:MULTISPECIES: bile acid:sodium symporter family protein [Pontibacter]MBC5772441.1 bile acid:sodium symporter [Pontibacter sp. KCTC 32443]